MKPLILDRDGVINKERDDYILTPKDWIPIKGSLEAISKAKSQGFYIIVVSNQSALGRGFGRAHRTHAPKTRLHGPRK